MTTPEPTASDDETQRAAAFGTTIGAEAAGGAESNRTGRAPSSATPPPPPLSPASAPFSPPYPTPYPGSSPFDPPTIPDRVTGTSQADQSPWPYQPEYDAVSPTHPTYPSSNLAYPPAPYGTALSPQQWPYQTAVATAPTWEPPRWVSALARPLPTWLPFTAVIGILLALAVVFLSGDDWGDGAARAGIAAGILALVAAVVLGVRSFAGVALDAHSATARRLVSGGVLVAVLLVTFGAGLGAAAPLHRSEAGVYEARHEWQHAIAEYTRGGETGSNAADVARVYDEWGEQLSASGDFADASTQFQLVLTRYPNAPAADTRAQTDSVTVYLAWSQQALQQQDYAGAMQHLDALLALSYCASDCQAQGATLDATAYYGTAEAKLTAGDYKGAVDTFHVLLNRFKSAPEATRAHGDVAKALLGLGQQLRSGATCSSAASTYQELAATYGDTSQGKQAAADLAAPEPVTGQFTKGVPSGAYVVLARNLYYNIPDSAYNAAVAPPAPRTTVRPDGTFRFNAIGQGTWDLVWGVSTGSGEYYQFSAHQGDGSPVWVATVAPLCPFDFGSIDESFPTP